MILLAIGRSRAIPIQSRSAEHFSCFVRCTQHAMHGTQQHLPGIGEQQRFNEEIVRSRFLFDKVQIVSVGCRRGILFGPGQGEEGHIDTAVPEIDHVELLRVQGQKNVMIIRRCHATMLNLVHEDSVGVERMKVQHDVPFANRRTAGDRRVRARRRVGDRFDVLQKIVGIVGIVEIAADDVEILEHACFHLHQSFQTASTVDVIVDVHELMDAVATDEGEQGRQHVRHQGHGEVRGEMIGMVETEKRYLVRRIEAGEPVEVVHVHVTGDGRDTLGHLSAEQRPRVDRRTVAFEFIEQFGDVVRTVVLEFLENVLSREGIRTRVELPMMPIEHQT